MHTWSHAGLTTLTNHQIVAEIKWTEKIIRDTTGLTMKYVRPPYGDIDNRVREILRQMGYTTVIWTVGWDTNDWRMLQHQVGEPEVIQNFRNVLERITPQAATNGNGINGGGGPITLEHDLTDATISLSKKLIPLGQGPGGAVDKPNGGDGRGMARGMPGMEEADFGSESGRKATVSSGGSSSSSSRFFWRSSKLTTSSTTSTKTTEGMIIQALKQTMTLAAVGLTVVASTMLWL
ncbi:chitin deacetylase [Podila humilis]|nr:chitin deacetylase [Podila humilis]